MRMKKSTVFFYTNNFLSKGILENTLNAAIEHCNNNDAYLLITSHYPLSKDFIDVSGQFPEHVEESQTPKELSEFYVKDLRFDLRNVGVNYVVGKLPYKAESILRQLIFSCDNCKTENAVLFEHDCFYPDNYIKCVEEVLSKSKICHCMQNYCMLNERGFFICEPHPFLSSFSAKTGYFSEIFKHKKTTYIDAEVRVMLLEPFILYKLVKKRIEWKGNVGRMKSSIVKPLLDGEVGDGEETIDASKSVAYRYEKPIEDSFCLDNVLGDKPILELQHGLNTTNSLFLMRDVYDNAVLNEKEKVYADMFLEHSYWGKAERFIKMVKSDNKYLKRIERAGLHMINI